MWVLLVCLVAGANAFAGEAIGMRPVRTSIKMRAIEPTEPVLVVGDGCMQLLCARLANKFGFEAIALVPKPELARSFLVNGEDDAVQLIDIADTSKTGPAISSAKAMIIANEGGPPTPQFLDIVLNNGPEITRVSILSKIGATAGGLAAVRYGAFKNAEEHVTGPIAAKDIEWTVLCAGKFLGGGPGGAQHGLGERYYTTNPDTPGWAADKAFDLGTLGVTLSSEGDVPKAPFGGFGGLVEADTGRTGVAGALVQALRQPSATNRRLNVGAARSETPPTQDDWDALFNAL